MKENVNNNEYRLIESISIDLYSLLDPHTYTDVELQSLNIPPRQYRSKCRNLYASYKECIIDKKISYF